MGDISSKRYFIEVRHLKASLHWSVLQIKHCIFEQSRFLVGKSSWFQMSYCYEYFPAPFSWNFFLIHFILNCSEEKNIVHIISENGEQTDSEMRGWKYSAGVQLNTRVEALSLSLWILHTINKMCFRTNYTNTSLSLIILYNSLQLNAMVLNLKESFALTQKLQLETKCACPERSMLNIRS